MAVSKLSCVTAKAATTHMLVHTRGANAKAEKRRHASEAS